MPTYEYECASCRRRFEVFQPMTEKPKRRCPQCGRSRARRLLGSGAGILFKGSGFYQTDYRKKPVSAQGSPSKNGAPPAKETAPRSGASEKKDRA